MPLQKLQIKPGVNRENTRYSDAGGWWNMNRVRFRAGFPEAIGGWVKFCGATFVGVCRLLVNWTTLASNNILAIGTNLKIYLEFGNTFYDITPIRLVTGSLTNPFATQSGSSIVTVTVTAHGALQNDFVTFSGAVGFNGILTATLNSQFQVVQVLTVNTFTITATQASGTGSGGGTVVVATFEINTGPVTAVAGTGWGVPTWGGAVSSGSPTGWGIAAASGVLTQGLYQWVGEHYGQDFCAAPRFGTVYYWQPTTGGSFTNALQTPMSTLATFIAANGADPNPPLFAGNIVVTDNQFLVLFGTNVVGSSTLNPMAVRWCDEGNVFTWTPSITNQAGDQVLSSGSQIVAAKKMRQEIVIWTDSSVISMQYVGAPIVFSFYTLSISSSLVGVNAIVAINNVAYWMAHDRFMRYDGVVQVLPCSVRKYVFSNLNKAQIAQTYASANDDFYEVTWFYCSVNATSPDSYVTYNYMENIWSFGTLARSAWLHAPLLGAPIAAGLDGYIYLHESGVDDGSQQPPVSLNSFIESAGVELGDGQDFSFVSKVIPDVDFTNSTANNPTVNITVAGRNTPGDQFIETQVNAVNQTNTVPFNQFTPFCYTRIRGRAITFRLDCTTPGVAWTLGTQRIELRPDGQR